MAARTQRMLHTERLRSATYDESAETLEVAFHNRNTLTYREVPPEVARRFFAADNPETYWEDRIADEYPSTAGRLPGNPETRAALDALFGKPPGG